jgi:hypothetical protein
VQSLDGSAHRAVSAEGVFGALISSDQKWIAAVSPAGPVLVPVEGSAQPVRGVQLDDHMQGWTSDGQL